MFVARSGVCNYVVESDYLGGYGGKWEMYVDYLMKPKRDNKSLVLKLSSVGYLCFLPGK